MQPVADAASHPAVGLTPDPQPNAPWRVAEVAVLGELRLAVRFVDGTRGRVELADFLASPRVDGTVFEPLREPGSFAQVSVVLGAVSWPCGADLAPDAMYDAIRSGSVWRPA